jgi:hypothetical protein
MMKRIARTLATGLTPIALLAFAAGALADDGTTSTTTTTGTVPQPVTTAPVTTEITPLMRIQRAVAKINQTASTPEGEEQVIKQICTRFSVTPDSLQSDRARWGLNYGETAMVYTFAKSSKKPVTPDQVVEMRQSGEEWDAIAKDLGVPIQTLAKRMNKNVPPTPAPKPAK